MQTSSCWPWRRYALKSLVLVFVTLALGRHTLAQVSLYSLNTTYYQDFNIMASPPNTTGTVLPQGWTFLETGTGADNVYSLVNANVGDTYAYGYTDSASERALGALRTSSLSSTFGVKFVNNTGRTITKLTISYYGEYWRCGALSRPDELTFSYSYLATSLTSSGYIDYAPLSFNSDSIAGSCKTSTSGIKDGNTTCRTFIKGSITGLNIANGGTFWLKWTDFNATGADDGMAVDDFSLTAYDDNTANLPSGPFSYDSTNTKAGLGKVPTQPLDIVGNVRASGKMIVGNVTDIDIANLGSYSLAVNGNVLANKLTIKKYANWPDYVFGKNYQLMSLPDLQKYIAKHQHLPALPSAEHVAVNGFEVGTTQAVLLRKIEELTLYLIRQDDELRQQKILQRKLEKKIESLQKAIKK